MPTFQAANTTLLLKVRSVEHASQPQSQCCNVRVIS